MHFEKPQTAKQAVEQMEQLLDKGSWCQKFYATDHEGKAVLWAQRSAEKFCLRGAMFYVCNIQKNGASILNEVERAFIRVLDEQYDWTAGIANWNDANERTSSEVFELLRKVKDDIDGK